ncbi:unnamed protein product [Rotaria socialis]|uniref:Uncharacterized protein n=1 Tax=Rotaria socialis TaxID=392032 RepID=A0A820Q803_9BILA|nr:unnamed protein product [Rotaria socialis]CAF4641643.1 unnamed protein product [Rotaria socialis]
MGVSAIKGAGKGVKTFATAMREQEIEQTTTKPVPGGNTAGLELVKARKKIITSLTMKQIAVLTNEKVLRKGLIKLVDGKQWDSIGRPLCTGILSRVSSAEKKQDQTSLPSITVGIMKRMSELTFIVEDVYDQLLTKLSEMNQELLPNIKYCSLLL